MRGKSQNKRSLWVVIALLMLQLASGQDYAGSGSGDPYYEQEYQQDNLYHDYAARQQEKAAGGAVAGAGPVWQWAAGGGVAGWFLGSAWHCRRQKKKLETKFKADQKALYQQYYEDVYSLQVQNAELIQALEQMGVKIKQ
mmetsp:Transcript_19336/g.41628  ORF Transcript_19336/g.41628 Transcript_19336/m.41628 type:complete len:140 (+) Transcript_19336:22-441(+)